MTQGPLSRTPHTVAITGASGMIGSALTQALRQRGDAVVHLVRRTPRPGETGDGISEVQWSPEVRTIEDGALNGVDTVVHLAGANLGDKRWNNAYKKVLVSSRVDGTETIAQAVAEQAEPPRLISASAIGYYGDRGDAVLDEQSAPGDDFVADLCVQWEASTGAAQAAGSSVALIRTGIVLSREGGAMGRVLPLAKVGLGGPLGSGDQYWAWIALPDHLRAVLHLIDHPDIAGPVNLTAPSPAPQSELMKALGKALGRPSFFPAPGFAIKLAVGEMAAEVLGSRRVLPEVLLDSGFTFDYPDLESAMRWLVARSDAA